MNLVLTSAHVEFKRLTRTGLLTGLVAVFAFFGVSSPALALLLPDLLRSAASTEQLTVHAATATPGDALALYVQSAMQLGLVLAAAVAVTALGWDARPGSSVFYRTRSVSLAALVLPRVLVGWVVVVVCHLAALTAAAVSTAVVIAPVESQEIVRLGAATSAYLVMAMAIGHVLMATLRRTAAALATTTLLMLVLPLLNSLPGAVAWAPTALLAAATASSGALVVPYLTTIGTTAACLLVAARVTAQRSIRRDA
ncbi:MULTISPECIES: hypothetical protein [unclassified Curtobacterium]|uniref:hypothetical protein n=1 Tax=unclassified Curtobacterium TaxID=257496 RepID=UPI000830D833|nr:hypothetical protein [Curtobacterium sp. MR_MD2014]